MPTFLILFRVNSLHILLSDVLEHQPWNNYVRLRIEGHEDAFDLVGNCNSGLPLPMGVLHLWGRN